MYILNIRSMFTNLILFFLIDTHSNCGQDDGSDRGYDDELDDDKLVEQKTSWLNSNVLDSFLLAEQQCPQEAEPHAS